MARVCMRPGCERAAAARLTFDPVSCQAWLDVLVDLPGSAQEVCELHADRLTLPRGWILCDRRADEPALFVGATASAPAASPAKVVRRRRAGASSPQVPPALDPAPAELFDAPLEPVVAEPLELPFRPSRSNRSLLWSRRSWRRLPARIRRELSASSPLLARAFRATGDQHSVLTEGARPVRPRAPDRRLDGT